MKKQLLKKKELEKELFTMAYRWGGWGVVVDENCPAFQQTLKQYAKLIREEVKK